MRPTVCATYYVQHSIEVKDYFEPLVEAVRPRYDAGMPPELSPRTRAAAFCQSYGLTVPVLLAPMAGACPVSLSIAVANAGGMGAMGALVHDPRGIAEWVSAFRAQSRGPFQLNTWVPDRPTPRDHAMEDRMRGFLST